MITYKVTKVDLKNNTADIFTSSMNASNIETVREYYKSFDDGCIYLVCNVEDLEENIYDTIENIFNNKYEDNDFINVFCLMGYCKLTELKIKDLTFTCSLTYRHRDLEIESVSNCVVHKGSKVVYSTI